MKLAMILLLGTLILQNIVSVKGAATQHLLDYSFEDGGDDWSGTVDLDDYPAAYHGDMFAELDSTEWILQEDLWADSEDVFYFGVYVRGGGSEAIYLTLYYSSGDPTADYCSVTSNGNWMNCAYDGTIPAGRHIIAIDVLGVSDGIDIDRVELWTGLM